MNQQVITKGKEMPIDIAVGILCQVISMQTPDFYDMDQQFFSMMQKLYKDRQL